MSAITGFAPAEELVGRLYGSLTGAYDLFAIYIGDRLGFYRSLEDAPATSVELAAKTGTAERYAREWLEQQSVTGILAVDDASKPARERVFSLPGIYRDIFLNPDSPLTMTGPAQVFVGTIKPIATLLEAFKTGDGVPYEDYGDDLAMGVAKYNRPMFVNQLAQEYIPAMPDIHARLLDSSPARIADIGMGLGWSSIALARAYPSAMIDGFDLDERSVELANGNAAEQGVSDRVKFHHRDAGDADLAGKYDFALAMECIHDMSDPVSVLKAMRRLVGPGGTVLIADEKAEDSFAPMGSDLERTLYGFSLMHCLPVGMVNQPAAGTGAVMRQSTFREYAAQAGFQRVDILPVEHDGFHFYRLTA